MYSHEIPTSVDVHLNTIGYPIETYEYALKKPDAYKNKELVNYFIPDKNAIVLTRATIADMIEFNDLVISFKILYSKDIIEIYRYLKIYIDSLSQFSDIKEAVEYLSKARALFFKLEKTMKILCNRGNQNAIEVFHRERIGDILDAFGG